MFGCEQRKTFSIQSMPLHKGGIDDNEILKLYKDLSFPASFRGIKTFRAVLQSDKGISVSENKLRQILQKEPTYLIHQLKPFKTKRRATITHNYGELVQADISYMLGESDSAHNYFLLLIDVYSNKIFVEILRNKDGSTVAKALEEIFKRFGAPIYEIQEPIS
ncbi:MAG: transposase family protein [Sphingomonadales bacterium]|nr:transposase family protein [Sphingomonadales bacterium]